MGVKKRWTTGRGAFYSMTDDRTTEATRSFSFSIQEPTKQVEISLRDRYMREVSTF